MPGLHSPSAGRGQAARRADPNWTCEPGWIISRPTNAARSRGRDETLKTKDPGDPMDNTIVAWLLEHYEWRLSLIALGGILASTVLLNLLLSLIPTFKKAQQVNKDTFKKKMAKPIYAANQKWNRKWSV